ncbi:GreA/GreB family elongation factor [Nocardiopsis sp. EMB25]|uniref:GreA/GreB family elongation factor n=1 Tax=Nocardiopsis sp. EMB25 TaxID=2835867 RepID=UPI0022841E39|nr:GreA/GreB family elongation factor [Nocardiopsis sp. EMB25]MCY9783221.1 GreA/GreB family elongation factor [Nocardiopsis sp. EMB25]
MPKTAHDWMPLEAYERLREELRVLTSAPEETPGEDGGALETVPAPRYIDDPAVRQARVHKIERLLREAVVGRSTADDGVAEPGKVLTIRYDGEGESETFLLGVRDASVSNRLTVYSPESPLGATLVGARQGERRTFASPHGATIGVTLVRAAPYGSQARD